MTPLKPCWHDKYQSRGNIQRETDEMSSKQDQKKGPLYADVDIRQHVETQQTSDLCAVCTHPHSQVKMDKMSSPQHSGAAEGAPPPASQSAAPPGGGRCEYFESNALCYLSHNICITESNSKMSAFNQFK